jgi:hypothetical protein
MASAEHTGRLRCVVITQNQMPALVAQAFDSPVYMLLKLIINFSQNQPNS